MLLMKKGAVDLMIEQWARERPDLDSSSLSVLARISRLARVAEDDADKVLSQFDLSSVEFHLLAAIRTTPDYRPSPRDLLGPLMVSSGGLTNRIDRLERAGLLERITNARDRRGILLQLTAEGREVVDRVTAVYLANQNDVLNNALTKDERELLGVLLRKLLNSLAGVGETGATPQTALST
jgi:DNA-binding MarR family transcriptional regulator